MDVLTEELWENFYDSDKKKFNGSKFGGLISIILNRGFTGIWKPTKGSWDDAHDFFELRLCDSHKRWAECKMYRTNLSTHVFAKTLILAINNDIDIIYLFSYSPLVKNAFIHIGNFAKKSGKKIQVFDDVKLEQLIFRYLSLEELKKLFPKLSEYKIRSIKPIEIYSSFYKDVTTSLSQFSGIDNFENKSIVTNRKSLNVYEIIIVSNEIENEIDIHMDFSHFFDRNNGIDHCVDIINLKDLLSSEDDKNSPQYIRRLSCGEVLNIRLYVIPMIAGTIKIPPIKIQYRQYEYMELEEMEIKVEEVTRPPYIGPLNLIEKITNEVDLNTRIQTFAISGESGVGKSRFSEEMILKLLERNFDVYILEGKYFLNKTFSDFIVDFLTQLYKIPNPNLLISKGISCNNDYGNVKDEKTLIEICANDKSIRYDEYKTQIRDYVYSIFLKKKSALIVDDIQFLNDDVLRFLMDIFELNNQPGRHLITYIFNTELLNPYSKHFAFYHNITHGGFCRCIELRELSQEEARLFIDSILQIGGQQKFSYAHPYVYSLIIKHIPLRPFYLLQFIELAKDKKCISLKNGLFFVDNISQFHKLLNCPPDKQIDVLKERIFNLNNQEKTALYIIGIFGNIDFFLFESLHLVDKKIIFSLIERKFLNNNNGILTFYHSLVDNFVIQYDVFLSEEQKNKINNFLLSKTVLRENYPLALFHILCQEELFDTALSQIDYYSQITLRNKKYAQNILVYIYKQNINPSRYIKHIMKVVHIASQNNQRLFVNTLTQLWKHLESYQPTDDGEAACLIEIIREIGSYFSVFNDFKESIKYLNAGILRLEKLQIGDLIKIKLKSRLINRIGVSYKQERCFKEAVKYTTEGYNLAIYSNCKVMKCLSLIDLGYIYMGLANKNNLVIQYWDQVKYFSENYYEELYNADSNTAMACKYIHGILLGIKGNYTAAISIFCELMNIAMQECSAYYELQAKRGRIFFEYLSGMKNSLLEEQINNLVITSSEYNLLKFHVFAYHMLALYYEDVLKPELARRCYENIVSKIFDTKLELNFKSLDVYLLYKDFQRFFVKNPSMERNVLSEAQASLLEQIYSDSEIYPKKENCLFSMEDKFLSIP